MRSHLGAALSLVLAGAAAARADDAMREALARAISRLPSEPAAYEGAPAPADVRLRRIAGGASGLGAAMDEGNAAEEWFAWAEAQGLWRRALVGRLTADERTRLRLAASNLVQIAGGAAEALDRAIEEADRAPALGRDPAFEDDIAEALHMREVALPLRAARALLALAFDSGDRESRSAFTSGAAAMLKDVAPVSPWAQLERELLGGYLALLQGDGKAAGAEFAKARTTAAAGELPEQHARLSMIEAMVGGVRAEAGRDGVAAMRALQTSLSAAPSLAPALLSTDEALLIADASLAMAMTVPEGERDDALSLALARYYLALRTPGARDPSGVERTRVLQHLAHRLPQRSSYRSLHPIAALALGHTLALDDAARARGVAALDEMLARPSAELGELLREGRFERAVALAGMSDENALRRATEESLAFAAEYAQDERSGLALAMACAASDALLRAAAEGGASDAAVSAAVDLALKALRAASAPGARAPGQDDWRLALARLLVWRIESGIAVHDEAEQAAREVSAVCDRISNSTRRAECAVERAAAWSAVAQVVEGARASEAATRALGAVEDAEAELPPGVPPGATARLAVSRAQAMLALEQPREALASIGGLVNGPGWSSLDPALRIAALRCSIRARIGAAGELESVLADAAALEALAPGAARSVIGRMALDAWSAVEPLTLGFPADMTPTPLADADLLALRADWRLAEDGAEQNARDVAAIRLAWAALVSGDYSGAEERFAALSARGAPRPSVWRGLGEARLALGDDAGAFSAMRSLATSGAPNESPHVWRAWTRMIEILARQNEGGRRNAEIRREIARLRTLESALEQPECLARLRAVEERLERR